MAQNIIILLLATASLHAQPGFLSYPEASYVKTKLEMPFYDTLHRVAVYIGSFNIVVADSALVVRRAYKMGQMPDIKHGYMRTGPAWYRHKVLRKEDHAIIEENKIIAIK